MPQINGVLIDIILIPCFFFFFICDFFILLEDLDDKLIDYNNSVLLIN